jgi:hypothetical protein
MITFREIFPKYLKICREYSLNMAEAADFSMPDAFAKDYLDSFAETNNFAWNYLHVAVLNLDVKY